MASISETGHAKNVENFEKLISAVTGYGLTFNPSKESLKFSALEALLTDANKTLNNTNHALLDYSNTVAARVNSFSTLTKLITRVNNAIKITDTSSQISETATSIIRKLQGTRTRTKITNETQKPSRAEKKEISKSSTSQMSYDSRLSNLEKLITLLNTVESYNPNEEDLKVSNLIALHNDLNYKNSDVVIASIQLSNSRISRNRILYHEQTGLVDIATSTKVYIKSVYGASSPQFKQVSKLNFITPKL